MVEFRLRPHFGLGRVLRPLRQEDIAGREAPERRRGLLLLRGPRGRVVGHDAEPRRGSLRPWARDGTYD